MSLSNNVDLKNPATKPMQWSSDHSAFKYWDKTKGEQKEDGTFTGANIIVALPLTFIVLDTLSTIRGYSKTDKCGYYSNEVRDLKKEILVVKNKTGECEKGLYADIIRSEHIKGAKYCQSVYIAHKESETLVIANIQMVGSCLSAWIDFRKKNDVYKGAVSVSGFEEKVNGKTTYNEPIFKFIPVSETTKKEAIELDKILQEYLVKYFNKSKIDQVTQAPVEFREFRDLRSKDSLGKEEIISTVEQFNPQDSDTPPQEYETDDLPF